MKQMTLRKMDRPTLGLPFKAEFYEHEGRRILFLRIWEGKERYREWCSNSYSENYLKACRDLIDEAVKWYANNEEIGT